MAGNTQNHFIVNPNTGVIQTAAALDREGLLRFFMPFRKITGIKLLAYSSS